MMNVEFLVSLIVVWCIGIHIVFECRHYKESERGYYTNEESFKDLHELDQSNGIGGAVVFPALGIGEYNTFNKRIWILKE